MQPSLTFTRLHAMASCSSLAVFDTRCQRLLMLSIRLPPGEGPPWPARTASHEKDPSTAVMYCTGLLSPVLREGEGDHARTHRDGLTSTTPTSAKGPVMTPSGLVSAMTFFIIVPTAFTVRLLTLLSLNAVVLSYPSALLPRENEALASFDSNSTLELCSKNQTTDYLPLWFAHILQNYNLSQLMPQWKGRNAPIAVSIHLAFGFPQPPVNHSFDHIVTINMTGSVLQNGIPQLIVP